MLDADKKNLAILLAVSDKAGAALDDMAEQIANIAEPSPDDYVELSTDLFMAVYGSFRILLNDAVERGVVDFDEMELIVKKWEAENMTGNAPGSEAMN